MKITIKLTSKYDGNETLFTKTSAGIKREFRHDCLTEQQLKDLLAGVVIENSAYKYERIS